MFQAFNDGGGEGFAEELLDRNLIRSVIRLATMRTGIPVLDNDLEQEALLRVLLASRRTSNIEYPKAFVAKIVRDTVQDYWRKHRRFENLDSIPEQVLSYRPTIEVHIDRERQRERLFQCLGRLSLKTRQAIELFYLNECSIDDLAASFHFSRSAAKMTLLRGRRELRKMMEASTVD